MTVEIKPLAQPRGAEVRGVDLTQDIPSDVIEQLKQALREHLVLLFRGHVPPTGPEFMRFARNFGDLIVGTDFLRDPAEYPEILPITNLQDEQGYPLGTGAAVEFPWHLDYSYLDRVAKESFLDAVELPRAPSSTHFCDMYMALETLPDERVKQLRGMRAHHDLREFVKGAEDRAQIEEAGRLKKERDAKAAIERPPLPEYVRPVVMRHPETGREALYVSPANTRWILDVPEDESAALLGELFEHSTQEEFIYRHDWQVGDLILFDALGGMHRRDRFDASDRRYMRQLSSLA